MTALRIPRRGAPTAIAAKLRAAAARPVFRRAFRSYLAAQPSNLLADWTGTAASANRSTASQGMTLRRRARELRENSPIVARYANLCRDNIVGPDGVTLQARIPSSRGFNEAASQALEDQWYGWAECVTADKRSLIDTLCTFVESWKVEGEALIRMRPTDGVRPLQLEVLDADLLDQKYSDVLRNGNRVEQGIELDSLGTVVAYHLWENAEDESGRRRRKRWTADLILYHGHRSRPGQVRGITALAPVMLLIQHLEKLQEALVVLNRVTASKMGVIYANEHAVPVTNEDGSPLEPDEAETAPGEWLTLPFGYEAKMLDPGQPTAEYAPFATDLRREIAAGLHVAASSLTGNLSDANYGSQRGGLLLERDAWKMDQQALVSTVLRPLFAMWLRGVVMARAVVLPPGVLIADVLTASNWHPRRWPWIDPAKDGEGIEKMLELKLTSRTREANKQGDDWRRIVDEIAAEEKYASEKGVDLDIAKPASIAPNAPPPRSLRAVS